MENNITFTAKFISPVTVKKLATGGEYIPTTVNAVELSANNKNDLKSLESIKKLWGKDSYAGEIYEDALFVNDYYEEYRPSFYAITKQKDNFETLQPKDILSLAETQTTFGKIKSLDYLQTNPEFFFIFKQTLKQIGSAMLGLIENINKGRRIEVNPASSARTFYLKHEYKPIQENAHTLYKEVWCFWLHI